MKSRIISLLLPALILSAGLYAQYQPGMLSLEYEDSSGEKGITSYIYNGRAHPYKAVWELEDGSRWSVNTHVFNQDGNLVEKHREFSDSLSTDQFFSYSSSGRLIHETFSRSDGISGEVEYIYTDDRCLKADCKGLNGWFFGEIYYLYGATGQKDSALLFTGGQHAGKITYTFDENGRIREETWHFSSGFTQHLKFNYPDAGCIPYRSSNVFLSPGCTRLLVREEYDYNGQEGGPSYFEYSEKNKLEKKTFVRADGFRTVTEFFYHANGLLRTSVRHYNDGKTGTFTYTYDRWGLLTQRDFLRSDGSTGQESYRYDENGKLLSGAYLNFDNWLTGTLTFGHDLFDRVTSAAFRGKNGIDANLSFDYNSEGNLEKIHWLFSDGSTQSYHFFYQD